MSEADTNKTNIIIALIVVIAGLLAFVYWKGLPEQTVITPKQVAIAPAPVISVAPPAENTANTLTAEEILFSENEPTTESPAVTQQSVEPSIALPTLNESDVFLVEQFAPYAESGLLSLLVPDELIRKLVRAIIGISDNKLVNQYRPVISPLPPLGVQSSGSAQSLRYKLTQDNYERYNKHLALLEVISPEALANMYRTLEPLLEEAYAEQGLGGTFKPVLIKAIDNFLSAPVMHDDLWLVRPTVMYRFADPALELLPDPQKLLLRMGPTHTQSIQRYLTDLKAQL